MTVSQSLSTIRASDRAEPQCEPGRHGFCWLLLLFLCCLVGRLNAAPSHDPVAAFEQANKLYEQGRFTEAATAYERLVERGSVSPALYFNLGNALFKAGQTGRAIVNYRLAERLSPRDPDIRANLQFARNSVGAAPRKSPPWLRWFTRVTLNEWTMLAAGAVWLWLLLLTLGQRSAALKKPLRGYTATAGVVSIFLAACLGFAVHERWGEATAIVVAPHAVIRYGPLDESQDFYTVKDGTELTVLDRKDDWLQVTDSSARTGWLRREQVILLSAPFRPVSS